MNTKEPFHQSAIDRLGRMYTPHGIRKMRGFGFGDKMLWFQTDNPDEFRVRIQRAPKKGRKT